MSKPYTVTFGPWLPDLQNVGVEMPFQWTETELPVADCENVYYQDGAYRCLPGPSPVGPSLGAQVLGAFTWYDNTAGQEVLFGATANGFYTLVDGAWTQIPVQQNASSGTVGYALSIAMGAPFVSSVYLSPSSESATSSAASYSLGTVTALCGNGTPSSYAWSFSGASGPGSWSIASGAGTANVVPKVSGSTAGNTSSATLNCAVVVRGVTFNVSSSVSYTQVAGSHQNTYSSGSGTETVPAGYSNVVIEVWAGAGGGGQPGNTIIVSGIPHQYSAGAGGGSGYSRSSYSVTAGETVHYSVGGGGAALGAGSASSVSSGTLSITTLTANGGSAGQSYSGGSAGGNGGTASGGNQANVTGSKGENGGEGSSAGGTPQAGVYANNPATFGVGGAGALGSSGSGQSGAGGFVSFRYT